MPPLTVEVTAKVSLRQSVDVVAHFKAFDARQQEWYRTLDIDELGMSVEWERPLAALWPDDETVPISMVSYAASHARGDVDGEVRVTTRADGGPVYGVAAEWTESDFDALLAQVPWMAKQHADRSRVRSPEDEARMPGPLDVPLPLG